jgi:hypothetical protein
MGDDYRDVGDDIGDVKDDYRVGGDDFGDMGVDYRDVGDDIFLKLFVTRTWNCCVAT